MSLILNIDTSTEKASMCIARDGTSIAALENAEQKNHAAWLHPAIEKLLVTAKCTLKELDAVAITGGPGSYTGLRVGMATAKGLCYALNIPLISENTLRVIALATKQLLDGAMSKPRFLLAPMIDARRMEVFAALFNADLQEVVKSCAIELNSDSFSSYINEYQIYFAGNGSEKFRGLINHEHAKFLQADSSAVHLAELSSARFSRSDFCDLIYTEPLYLKEFYTPPKK